MTERRKSSIFGLFRKNKKIDEFPLYGVEVSVIERMVKESPTWIEGMMTTADVVMEVVKMTEGKKESLLEYVIRKEIEKGFKKEELMRKQAMVFVSHAWKYTFKSLYDSIHQYKKSHFPNEPLFLWLDIFIINQHAEHQKNLPPEFFKTTFHTAIETIGRVALIADKVNDPMPLKRSWCVWEVYGAAKSSNVKLDVVVMPEEVERFRQGVFNDEDWVFISVFGNINIAKAEAFKKEDHLMIINAVKKIGINEVQDSCVGEIRNFLVGLCDKIALEAQADDKMTPRRKQFIFSQCSYFIADNSSGKNYQLAEKWALEDVKITRGLNNKHALAISLSNTAGLYRDFEVKAKFDYAMELYKEALQLKKDVNSKPENIARTYDNIAGLYDKMENYKEAEKNTDEALKLYQQVKDMMRVYMMMYNIAYYKCFFKEFKEAEAISREAYKIGTEKWNAEYYFCVQALCYLAYSLECQDVLENSTKRKAEYERYYALISKIHKTQRRHNTPAKIKQVLAKLIVDQKIIPSKRAKVLIKESYDESFSLNGPNHRSTLKSKELMESINKL